MMMSTPTITIIDLRLSNILLLTLTVVMLPFVLSLPVSISIAIGAIFAWRWLVSRSGGRLPGKSVRFMLVLVALALVVIQFGSLFGRDAGSSLLLLMVALKLCELRQRRDVLVILFMAYFILAVHFLFSQTIPMAVYVFAATWLLIACHMHLSHFNTQPPTFSLRRSGTLLLQAVPLMLIFFILFPRLPGPIWSLPKDAYSGMTGIGSEMHPGNISSLSRSNAVAFRVDFTGEPPTADKRYWRGPVLSLTDGRSWFPANRRTAPVKPLWMRDPINYTITLEPHNKKWIFALDLPSRHNNYEEFQTNFQIVSRRPVRQRIRYTLTSFSDYHTGPLTDGERHSNLMVPKKRNPRAAALAQRWAAESDTPEQIVQKALTLYNTEEFSYTLQPPLLLSNNPTDEFLFESRRGFCEHYASSFVMLMRAAGIPARVVTGYQGGELNPVGNYFIVRQRDAHAWAEVWLESTGWLRVDPTAAVAPERVESGIDLAATLEGDNIRFQIPESDALARLYRDAIRRIDAVNNAWNQWVIGYGSAQQAQFLQRLGVDIHSWRQLAWVLGGTTMFVLALSTLLMLSKRDRVADPVQRHYLRFCRKMDRLMPARADNESAGDFLSRIQTQRPDMADRAAAIILLYNQLRYSDSRDEQMLAEFKKNVDRF